MTLTVYEKHAIVTQYNQIGIRKDLKWKKIKTVLPKVGTSYSYHFSEKRLQMIFEEPEYFLNITDDEI